MRFRNIPNIDIMVRILFIILFFQSCQMFSQTAIEGKVFAEDSNPVPHASILIKDSDNQIIHYAFSDKDGYYKMKISSRSTIIIEVNKMGFLKYNSEISIKPDTINLVNLTLESDSTILKDMIIEINNPIVVRSDTLEFDAKSFSTGREVVVEDLLKNIPGIVVEKDGTIKYEDKKIEKLMIDGDDLFNRGYSLLSKNMPSKPVSKVQVLTKYSNNKLLKGIEDSSKVALNLTIDKDFQDLWFGDLTVGYGLVSENRYDASGNLMNFSAKFKNFLSGSLNNIGLDKIGSLEDMFYNNTEIESIGLSSQLYGIFNIANGKSTELKDHRTRLNNSENIALSSIFPINKKLKVKVSGFVGFDENYAFHSRTAVTNVENQNFVNYENSSFTSHLNKHYINLLATYDISKTNLLQISTVWNQGSITVNNDLDLNGMDTNERLKTRNDFFDQKITYTHQWKERNVLLLKTRYYTNAVPQFYNINDYLLGDLFSFEAQSVDNRINNKKSFIGFELDTKLKQRNGSLIDFQVGYVNSIQTLNTVFRLYDGPEIHQPSDFQTISSFNMGDLYGRTSFSWSEGRFKVTGRTEAHQLFNSFSTLSSQKKDAPFYINPSLNSIFELSPTQNISASYMITFQNSSVTQTNDTYILSSSRSFNRGLGEFKITDFQMGNVTYSIRHYLNRYRFALSAIYRKQNRTIANSSEIEQYSSLSQAFFTKGGQTYGVNLSSSFNWKQLKSAFSFDAGYSHMTSYNEVNNSGIRKNDLFRQFCKFSWRSLFRSFFNFNLGTEWTTSKVQSPDFINNYTNGFNFLDLYFQPSEQFTAKLISEHYYFGNLSYDQRNHIFVDFEVLYKFKGDKYTISLRGNNMLNKTEFRSYYVNEFGYSTTSYRLMPRYLLASCKVRF